MTPEFEKWVKSKQGEASSFDISEADFWIRNFVEDVKLRAPDSKLGTRAVILAEAFSSLERELFGGKSVPPSDPLSGHSV